MIFSSSLGELSRQFAYALVASWSELRISRSWRDDQPTKRTLNYLYLNYLSPYQQLIQAQGRHLFVMKCYHGRDESHCWFIPAAEVVAMHADGR